MEKTKKVKQGKKIKKASRVKKASHFFDNILDFDLLGVDIEKKDVLTLKELAKFLGLNVMTLYRNLKKLDIPKRKIGNKYLFSKKAVLEWLAKGK